MSIHKNYGQAVITILFTVVIGMLVTTGAILTLVTTYGSQSNRELAALAYSAAETGIENGILRLLRDPSYTGETMTLDLDRSAVVTVTQTPDFVIFSVGSSGSLSRKIQVQAHMTNTVFTIDSWKEIP